VRCRAHQNKKSRKRCGSLILRII
jgi:hypothetical protein